MQRRAAAISAVVFLLLAAGSYTLIGAAEQPGVELSDPAYSITVNEKLTFGDRTYTFTKVGSGAATATWINESARQTAKLKEGKTITYKGNNFTVFIPNATNVSKFQLREVQTVSQPTVTQGGTTYVIIKQSDGDRVLKPLEEYLPTQTIYTFQEGDQLQYMNNMTTVTAIKKSSVTLTYFAPEKKSLTIREATNTTLGGTKYLAHFTQQGGEQVLILTTDYHDYFSDKHAMEFFHERMKGLWGVTILSFLTALLLIMFAYMPSRY